MKILYAYACKILHTMVIGTFLIGCQNNPSDKHEPNRLLHDQLTTQPNLYADRHYLWSTDFDSKKGMKMVRTQPIADDSLTVSNIINILNSQYPEIVLHVVTLSNDSLFVQINNSTYLTEQSGSSGAQAYLAEATYNLTEIPGIHFVHFAFKAGDHASPDTYSRTDFLTQ